MSVGEIYRTLGDYPKATAVPEPRRGADRSRATSTSSWARSACRRCACAAIWRGRWPSWASSPAARTVAAEAMRLADASHHPYSVCHACLGLGGTRVRQGEFESAIGVLGRGFATSEQVPLLRPPIAADLGVAYARCGRIAEGLSHLDAAVEGATSMGRLSRLPLLLVKCGEIHLLAGEPDEATRLATTALRLATEQKERGNEVYARHLLAEICAAEQPASGGGRTVLSRGIGARNRARHATARRAMPRGPRAALRAERGTGQGATITWQPRSRCTGTWRCGSGWSRSRPEPCTSVAKDPPRPPGKPRWRPAGFDLGQGHFANLCESCGDPSSVDATSPSKTRSRKATHEIAPRRTCIDPFRHYLGRRHSDGFPGGIPDGRGARGQGRRRLHLSSPQDQGRRDVGRGQQVRSEEGHGGHDREPDGDEQLRKQDAEEDLRPDRLRHARGRQRGRRCHTAGRRPDPDSQAESPRPSTSATSRSRRPPAPTRGPSRKSWGRRPSSRTSRSSCAARS